MYATSTSDTIILILLLIVMLFVLFVLPQWSLRRAIPALIQLFRQHKALSPKDAKTMDELGLKQRSLAQAILRGQDYRVTALQILRNANIVRATDDGRLYLSEEDLQQSRWRNC